MNKFDSLNGLVMKINDELSDVKMSAEKRKTITALTSELLKKLEKQDEELSEIAEAIETIRGCI